MEETSWGHAAVCARPWRLTVDLAAYGAAKAGLIGLTRAAALELAGFGMTVHAIAPGAD